MKKIAIIPLDERPCNYDFPQRIAAESDYEILVPPRSILGKKKESGDIEAIWAWLFDHIEECDGAILSVDMLVYSGIVPSRLHHYGIQEMLERLEQVKRLKEINPRIPIYAFSLIMRNPKYSSSDEEPCYYEDWGSQIHRYGEIKHLEKLNLATGEDRIELEGIERDLPQVHLRDYLGRREKNIQINKRVVEMTSEGIFDFVVIPQDDASLYGLTAMDQQIIRRHIRSKRVGLKAYMYPDADAVVNTLLARMINHHHKRRPMIYIKYASATAHAVVPLYEDRMVHETIKYQIMAAGGLVASSASEADIVMIVNLPASDMQDLLAEEIYIQADLPSIPYDASRNLIEIVEYGAYVVETLKKPLIVADIAYANGGDMQLFDLLGQQGLLFKLAGYAGWNTSSNTLGTCIPMGMVYSIFGDRKAHQAFLAHRYLEDIGFCAMARRKVSAENGTSYRYADGIRGTNARQVREELELFAKDLLHPLMGDVQIKDVYLPWGRMFEVGLEVEIC